MARNDPKGADGNGPLRDESSVGQMLREEREALDLTLDQISDDLRIETRFLSALEDDDFESFAAPVFAKGYLRQYASRLKLDDKSVLTLYYRQVGAQDAPSLRSNSIKVGLGPQQVRWLIAGSAGVFVIAAAFIWWLSFGGPEPGSEPDAAAVAPFEEPEIRPEELAEEALGAVPEEANESSLQVEIVFQEDSWTEVIDARDERVFYGLGSASARARFEAMPPLSFFFGNASGVEIFVNDRPFTIPDQNRQGNLARFMILEADNIR